MINSDQNQNKETKKSFDLSKRAAEQETRPSSEENASRKGGFKKNIFWKRKLKRIWAFIIIVFIALLAGATIWGYYLNTEGKFKLGEFFKKIKKVSEKQYKTRLIDGVYVHPDHTNPPLVAIIIENLVTVRPQSGLSNANLVYEALAEGGITRFLAVFAEPIAEKIGPVRSLRPYYIEWSSEYDALIAHIGGSPEALAAVEGLGIHDLNAMYAASKYFWRDPSIPAPHNLFTSGENMGRALRDEGIEKPKFDPWKFKDDDSPDLRPTDEKKVYIDFSGPSYSVEWKYDQKNNRYLRFNGGVEHKDANTAEQIWAKNVVVTIIPPVEVIDNYGRVRMDVTGSGKAYIFSDGQISQGTWKKPSRTERTRYYDEGGKEHEFVRGKTWVEIVPSDKNIIYQ